MIKSRHTPGPWYAEIPTHILPEANDPGPYYFIEPKADPINLVAGFHIAAFLSHADARLIAAAPDLLEELTTLVQAIEGHRYTSLDNDGLWHYAKKAEALIVKVKAE